MRNAAMIGVCALAAIAPGAVAQPFTYQGSLTESNQPADGQFTFTFRLYDEETLGNRVGPDLPIPDLAVDAGLFTVQLDFGADAFDPAINSGQRWLLPGIWVGMGRACSRRDPAISTNSPSSDFSAWASRNANAQRRHPPGSSSSAASSRR